MEGQKDLAPGLARGGGGTRRREEWQKWKRARYYPSTTGKLAETAHLVLQRRTELKQKHWQLLLQNDTSALLENRKSLSPLKVLLKTHELSSFHTKMWHLQRKLKSTAWNDVTNSVADLTHNQCPRKMIPYHPSILLELSFLLPVRQREKTQLFVVTKDPMALFMVCLNSADAQSCLNFASDELDKSLGDFKWEVSLVLFVHM